jgi:nucleoside-diphosphate-sugar epimerase
MKVVVFGAAGWLGRAVLENFAGKHQVRAFEYGPEAWKDYEDVDGGEWDGGEKVYGDIADFQTVDRVLEGMEGIVHLAVYSSRAEGAYGVDDDRPFLVNLKGLWNVLEAARQRNIRRIVHMGSCQVEHPDGIFFSADVRRPDGSLYAVTKRLQEEMCRQYHEAFGQSIIVFRPCSIVDARLGIGKSREALKEGGNSWVCRHDLAQACHLALETEAIDFDIMHTANPPEAEKFCNVGRTREVLGLEYRGKIE